MSSTSGRSRLHFAAFLRNARGFAITLDALFAVTIVFAVIIITYNYISLSKVSGNPEISASRLAGDIVAVLDYGGVLGTFNRGAIESGLNSSLPSNLKMSMRMSRYDNNDVLSDQTQINNDITDNFYTGKWVFVTFNGDTADFTFVEYKVGFK